MGGYKGNQNKNDWYDEDYRGRPSPDALLNARVRIIVALIALFGVIITALFPTNPPESPYTPVIVRIVQILFNNSETPDDPPLTATASPTSPYVLTETAISLTLTKIFCVTPPSTLFPTDLPTDLPPTATLTNTVPPPILTLTIAPSPTAILPTPSSTFLNTIEVSGSSNSGASFTVQQTGRYTFSFKEGGYCTYGSNPGFATCLPTIWIFEGDVVWEADGRTLNQNAASRIISPISDCGAGNGAYCNTIEDAEQWGLQSNPVNLNLTAGTTLTFIGVDHREAYLDNPGEVFIDVFYTP